MYVCRCSIDPYIFANFESEDAGKSISAKFRAFKFPDTNYVLFVGTVNVCIKSCLPVNCGEGIFGYGKRRRRQTSSVNYSASDKLNADPRKVFEAELSTFINVGYDTDIKTLSNLASAKRDDLYQLDTTNIDSKVTFEVPDKLYQQSPSLSASKSRNGKNFKSDSKNQSTNNLIVDPINVSIIVLISFAMTIFITEYLHYY